MPQRVEGSVEIQRPVGEVYSYWETLENLPEFMKNVEEIQTTGPDTTHWKIKGPFGTKLDFDARTTEREQNSLVAWNTVEGDVGTSGEVRFSDLGSGQSRVDVIMNYSDPPGGKLGERASRVIADPQLILEQDLENLRDLLEGEATPEDIQQRPAAADVQGGLVALLTSGLGLSLIGGLAVVLILVRLLGGGKSDKQGGKASQRGGKMQAADSEGKFRFTIEF